MASLKPEEEKFPFVDIFDEDETERNFMLSKPLCIIIFGKPGVGKTTLAQKISQTWKCTLVEALPLLEEHIATGTQLGIMLNDLLIKGQSIPDELVLRILLEKLHSLEVIHFGYVLSGLPFLSEDTVTVVEQIELIKNLSLKPDIIINIKCPDYDLCQRLSGQRQHSLTGFTYMREQWDPEVIENRRKKKKEGKKEGKEGKGEEEEEEVEEEEEEVFIAEMQIVAEIFRHLVQRPEDFTENIEASIHHYRDEILRLLEEMMADHDSQFLIELNGNKTAEELHKSVIDRFDCLGLRRAAVITRLQSSEEELSDGMDNDELFRTLSSYKLIAPRYRWHRSRWGRACPVALKEGHIAMGLPDLSVSFLGKMYCLSSEEALKAFMKNPRPYLLPPMPIPPCKVFVYGPKSSGKTTLCNLIAAKYGGQVLDFEHLMEPHVEEAKKLFLEKSKTEATEAAIKSVTERLQVEKLIKKHDLKENENKSDELKLEEKDSLKKIGDEEFTDEKSSENKAPEEKSGEELSSEQNTEDHSSEKKESETSDIVVTADHPDVQELVEEAMKVAKEVPIELQFEQQVDVLDQIYKDLTEKNKDRFPGAPKHGGWVMDNVPMLQDFWVAINAKGILPDFVVLLENSEDQGKFLLHRLFLENKSDIVAEVMARKEEEAEEKRALEQSQRKLDELTVKFEDDSKTKETEKTEGEPEPEAATEEHEAETAEVEAEVTEEPEMTTVESELPGEESEVIAEPEAEPEAEAEAEVELEILPEYSEDSYPEIPEMELMKDLLRNFTNSWKVLEAVIADLPLVQILKLEVAEKTPEYLLQQVVEAMDRPFRYVGWEMGLEDFDEETDDFQAEAEAEEEAEEDEEEEDEEDDEERLKEKRRHLGDTKNFCPVALKENFMLFPGPPEEGAKYREKVYYFSSIEAREKFLESSEDYVAHEEPLKAPPLRVCLLGPQGSGKTVCARWLAEKFGIFHIQFEEFLQEKIMSKTERRVGPEYDEEIEEEAAEKQELEEIAAQANIKLENEKSKLVL